MFKRFIALATGAYIATTNFAMSAPVTVDLSDAETSISNAGLAMVGIAVTVLGFILVISFIKKR